jgi:hypothetical protein
MRSSLSLEHVPLYHTCVHTCDNIKSTVYIIVTVYLSLCVTPVSYSPLSNHWILRPLFGEKYSLSLSISGNGGLF